MVPSEKTQTDLAYIVSAMTFDVVYLSKPFFKLAVYYYRYHY